MRHRSPPMPGEGARERRLAEMIRVDHAGEYGAVQIYRGQRAVFDRIEGKLARGAHHRATWRPARPSI